MNLRIADLISAFKASLPVVACVNSDQLLVLEKSDQEIFSLEFDSRLVKSGSVFFCISGEKADGHAFIEQVCSQGACLVVANLSRQAELAQKYPNLVGKIIFVEHVRKAMGAAASQFFGEVTKQVNLVGITGTNGKTTTAHLFAQIFSKVNKSPVGLLGTLGSKVYQNGECTEFLGEGSGRTTPEAPELHSLFKQLQAKGCKTIVMEVSSHSLEQGRVFGCDFKVAVFTNLTQDHLDYHMTMDKYFEAKAILFKMLNNSNPSVSSTQKIAILNADSSWSKQIVQILDPKLDLMFFSLKKTIELSQESESAKLLMAHNIQYFEESLSCDLEYQQSKSVKSAIDKEFKLPLNGEFNLYNALAATSTALALGADLDECLQAVSQLKAAPGRFQLISKPASAKAVLPNCIVDYAHTPDGLENVLQAAKKITPSQGKLVCVFGCGGDRDSSKRPIMGKFAEQYADFTYITSDNPRSEDPNQIIADIMTGISALDKVEVELDRAAAIEKAILEANENDLIIIAGKGHEDYQILQDSTIHFSDAEEVEKAYQKRLELSQ